MSRIINFLGHFIVGKFKIEKHIYLIILTAILQFYWDPVAYRTGKV